MLQTKVIEKCCRQKLQRNVADKSYREMLQTKVTEKCCRQKLQRKCKKTHFISNNVFSKFLAFVRKCGENVAQTEATHGAEKMRFACHDRTQTERPHMAMWHGAEKMRFACHDRTQTERPHMALRRCDLHVTIEHRQSGHTWRWEDAICVSR
jgi:hypothetical protein